MRAFRKNLYGPANGSASESGCTRRSAAPDPLGGALQILDRHHSKRDRDRPQFADRQRLNQLIGLNEAAQNLRVKAAVGAMIVAVLTLKFAWAVVTRGLDGAFRGQTGSGRATTYFSTVGKRNSASGSACGERAEHEPSDSALGVEVDNLSRLGTGNDSREVGVFIDRSFGIYFPFGIAFDFTLLLVLLLLSAHLFSAAFFQLVVLL